MKLNTLAFISALAILTQACGSGGGQSSSAAATEADLQQMLQNVNWVIQPATDIYGTCAYGARFTADGHFGIAQICDGGYIDVIFEAVSGSYKLANGRLDLKIDPDGCHGKNTALVEVLGLKSGMAIKLSENTFTVSGGAKVLSFDRDPKNKYFLHPMLAATRGCNERKNDDNFEWQLYSNPALVGSFDAQFDTIIKNSAGGSETDDGEGEDDPSGTPEETTGGGIVDSPSEPSFGSTLQMSNATGRVTGTIALTSSAIGENLFIRNNSAGDYLYLRIANTPSSGTGYTDVPASATVVLSQAKINAFNTYCEAQPVAVEFSMNLLAPGEERSNGDIPETVKLWAKKPNGQWCYGLL